MILQKNLPGLDSTDVGLAILDERITVDVGTYLLKEGLDVSRVVGAKVGCVVGIVRQSLNCSGTDSLAL